MPARWLPSLATLVALTLGLLLWAEDADARRIGDGLSLAGAGPPRRFAINSLTRATSPILTEPFVPLTAVQQSYPGGTLGEFFNRGDLIGAFAAGFLGAGLIGLLFGHGVIMELNSVASVLGLLFQLALIVMLGRLIRTWWRDDEAVPGADMSPRGAGRRLRPAAP